MPTDFAAETARMAEAFGLVAAGAIPVGVAGWWFSGRRGSAFARPAAWSGADILVLFLLHFVLGSFAVLGLSQLGWFQAVYGPDFPPPSFQSLNLESAGAVGGGAGGSAVLDRSADANAVRSLWGSLVSVPALLAAAAAVWVLGRGRRPAVTPTTFLRGATAGVVAWLVLTPAVLGINFVASWVMESAGAAPAEHPFTRIRLVGRPGTTALFVVVACVLAPLAEELLFRGLLVGWAATRRHRPWVVLAAGLLLAVAVGGMPADGRLVFWLGLAGGLAALSRRRPGRTAAAVFASAAAFGLAHPWWPTPVPLFAFGLGLGYLFVRTGGLVAPTVAHGLFNAVSFVYLLRGGTGGI